MKFRKKPVVIDAEQWDGKTLTPIYRMGCKPRFGQAEGTLVIETLEGDHLARPGDWIIKGVHGEFYPCKPEIFEKTYEPA